MQLWKIIENANWNKDHNYERIKNKFSNLPNYQKTQLFNFVSSLNDNLEKKYGNKIKNVSDDSWSDLKYEVIGRGRKFYNNISLSKLNEMNKKGDYKESFGYGILTN